MGASNYVGSKSKYDIVNRVIYGLIDGVDYASKKAAKDVNLGVVNFSNNTYWSGFKNIENVVNDSKNEFVKQLLAPEDGGTSFDSKIIDTIEKEKSSGKTCYIMLSDGAISSSDETYQKINRLTEDKNNTVISRTVHSNGQKCHVR